METAVVAPQQMRLRNSGAARSRRKFLKWFPKGFRDPLYIDWERDLQVAGARKLGDAARARAYEHLLREEAYARLPPLRCALNPARIFCFPSKKWRCGMRCVRPLEPRPLHSASSIFFTARIRPSSVHSLVRKRGGTAT